MYKDRK